jgi:hypothetical protein
LSWNLLSQSAGAALIASSPSFWRERIEVRVVPEEIALTPGSSPGQALAIAYERRVKLWFKTFFTTEVS